MLLCNCLNVPSRIVFLAAYLFLITVVILDCRFVVCVR